MPLIYTSDELTGTSFFWLPTFSNRLKILGRENPTEIYEASAGESGTVLLVILGFAALWLAVRREDTRATSSQHATRATRYPQEDIKVFF
jgi:hypothetical protein